MAGALHRASAEIEGHAPPMPRLARLWRTCYAMAMNPLRILIAATAAEICVASAVVAVMALAGAVNGWLDLLNCAAPLLIVTGLAAAAVMVATWPKSRFRAACVGAGLAAAFYGAAVSLPDAVGWLFQLGTGKGAAYRVVTANVFRNNHNPFHAVEALVDRRADAVIVEEINGAAQVGKPLLAAAYPYSSVCPEAGVEIWLKTPILAQGCGLATPPGSYRTWGQDFVWVRTLGPDGRPIVLAGVHLGRPYPPARQGTERQALADALAHVSGSRVLAAGDLNTVPSSFGMRKMDRLLAPLTRRTLWIPTFPALIGATPHRRWPMPFLAIDHVYADAGWSGTKLSRFEITGSDHFGLQVDAHLR